MTVPATRLYKGIEASLPDKADVTQLYVEAREADEFFYWSKSSDKAVLKLKVLFPNLEKLIIEDDYLIQSQIDALSTQLPPIAIEWTYRMYIDGRHGR
ncbi:MAG TPA: hypothetical protein VFW53_08355 [Gallionella sp.]|nr:hypothetical protein [Gallionella sp.]